MRQSLLPMLRCHAVAGAPPKAASSSATLTATPINKARSPACRSRSHSAATALAAIGIARKRLNRSIQRPGFGNHRRSAGINASARKGSPRPKPSAANTATEPAGGKSSAVPSAAPRNGPAQGVATKAASAPVPKLPAGCASPPSTGSSNRPSRLAVIATASRSSSMIVRGSCSWNAHPASAPAARIASRAAPSAPVPTIVPAMYATASDRTSPASPPARDRWSAFKARIGKTHGIRLSRTPPAIAPGIARSTAFRRDRSAALHLREQVRGPLGIQGRGRPPTQARQRIGTAGSSVRARPQASRRTA